jgi:CHAT domain-containing protein/tetratricopeptide (TPR) repeat protein
VTAVLLLRAQWPTASAVVAAIGLVAAQEGARVSTPSESTLALIRSGSYELAETAARADVDALSASPGGDSLEWAAAGDVLVRALVLNGRAATPETLALAQRILRIKETRLGREHVDLVPSLLNLGDVLSSSADFALAIAAIERALALCERGMGSDGLEVADALDHLGDALTGASRYDEAVRSLERSLRLKEVKLDAADVAIARTLEYLGLVLQSKGEYGRAAAVVQRAASIQQTADQTHPAYAGTLNLVAQQLWFEGALLESKAASERAVAVDERTLRPDHPTVALSIRFLANTLADLGDTTRSLELTERALALAERNFGSSHHVTAEYLHSLGLAELSQGDYPAARRHFEQALAIYQARYGQWNELVATAHSVLALADARLGDYASARREQSRAMSTFSRIGGPTHPYVAGALTKLAGVYLEEGLPAQALPLLERALAIREKVLSPEHRDISRTLVDLASTLMQTGRPVRAQQLAQRALDIWQRVEAPDAPEYATVLALYAELQANRGDNEAARGYYERAMTIRARAFGAANPLYAQAQSGLARSLASLGDRNTALTTALEAESTGRDHLRLMLRSLPERQALNYAASRPQGLNLILSLSTVLPDAAPVAFDAFIRSRALVLDEIAARQGAAQADPARAALASAQQRLANLTVRGPGQISIDRYVALLDDARQESERAEQVLAERSIEFRTERSRAQVGLADVVSALPPNTVLVSYARYERTIFPSGAPALASARAPRSAPRRVPSYVAFVLRSNRQPVAVALGSARAIDGQVSQWRADIAAEVLEAPLAADALPARSSRASGTALRTLIWDPVAIHIADAQRVVIVPDGTLSVVPFAALPAGRRSFVVESGPIVHYLSAERDLALSPRRSEAKGGLLAVGGPAFDRSVTNRRVDAAASPTGSSGSVVVRGSGQPCADLQTLKFPPLIGTAREVREVSALWRTNAGASTEPDVTQVLVGTAATEAAFKTDASRYRVLHLATHGFFLNNACAPAPSGTRGVGGLAKTTPAAAQNPLLLSGLALAGANLRAQAGDDDDDGILTAEEVAMLNLQGVEWAVLSACDTGVGEIKAGEGVFGLRRAFQVAGARTVIMSLWSVDDQATRAWMRALYEGRFQRQLSTADAVHQASLAVLRERRARGQSTHPFFWAAFVAAGDWR